MLSEKCPGTGRKATHTGQEAGIEWPGQRPRSHPGLRCRPDAGIPGVRILPGRPEIQSDPHPVRPVPGPKLPGRPHGLYTGPGSPADAPVRIPGRGPAAAGCYRTLFRFHCVDIANTPRYADPRLATL